MSIFDPKENIENRHCIVKNKMKALSTKPCNDVMICNDENEEVSDHCSSAWNDQQMKQKQDPNACCSKISEDQDQDPYAYVCTCSYITHVVGVVRRYLSNPVRKHREEVKQILRYLGGTSKLCLSLVDQTSIGGFHICRFGKRP